jgi:glycosyltransferase involved in cell wall biosynthesis
MKINEKPFFSVVIPLYNKERYIRNTIESVLSQTFQDFEVVVVNDGSKDNSAKILEELSDDRIRVIHQDNTGVSAARNRGIKESKAEYIALLDADDTWFVSFLERIHKLIGMFPEAGLYATAYKIKDAEGAEKGISVRGMHARNSSSLVPNYFHSVAIGDNLVHSSAVCVPKKVISDNNIWFPLGEKYGEDQYVWARVAVQYEVAYCTKLSAIYDRGAENNTTTAIQETLVPHGSFYMIKDLRCMIQEKEKLKGFDKYISKLFYGFPLKYMLYKDKFSGLRVALGLRLTFKHKLIIIAVFLLPRKILFFLKARK